MSPDIPFWEQKLLKNSEVFFFPIRSQYVHQKLIGNEAKAVAEQLRKKFHLQRIRVQFPALRAGNSQVLTSFPAGNRASSSARGMNPHRQHRHSHSRWEHPTMLFSMGHQLVKLTAPARPPDTGVDRRQWLSVQFAQELLKLCLEVISYPCASDSGTNKSSKFNES